jgi:hypothetical protein
MTGSQCARWDSLVSFWSHWIAFKTLLVVLDQGSGYVASFKQPCGFGSTRPFSTPWGLSNLAITIPSHRPGITWSYATTRLVGWGPTPGSIPLSLPAVAFGALSPQMLHRRLVCPVPRWAHWCFLRRKPKISLSVTPGLELEKLLSRCSEKRFGYLSGHPASMSDLATVT